MPKKIVLFLPVIYAVIGAYLWYKEGTDVPGIVLWIAVQACLALMYVWLIGDRSLGLMFNLHVFSLALGMLLLFYVLYPGEVKVSTGHLVAEVLLMGVGTFFCAIGVFSLLYMTVRKILA